MPRLVLACLAALVATWTPPAFAQATPPGDLTVAVSPASPFVEAGEDSTWDGLGIHLVRETAARLGRTVRVVRTDDPVAAVVSGAADVAVAPMTAADEIRVDFATPFYAARLGVARRTESRVLDVARRLFSTTFFTIALVLSGLLLVFGLGMWVVERRAEGDDFREGAAGVWDGFWWAGVTMTTIGYGDTVPRTPAGRIVALLWMLVSMGVTAALTAALVSTLGIGASSSEGARLPQDLRGDRVGAAAGGAAEAVLAEARVPARSFPTVADGLAAVEADSLDAFVASAPLLRVADDLGLRIETTNVDLQRWAFAVADGSELREPLSRAVLERVESPDWPAAVDRYLGSGP